MLKTKRVYEPPSSEDGQRFLVERLWPRGMRKDQLALDRWIKEVAPSQELRKWFAHDPRKWDEFTDRYVRELDANPEGWSYLLEAAKQGNVTLLYSAHDTQHNSALILKDYLNRNLEKNDGQSAYHNLVP